MLRHFDFWPWIIFIWRWCLRGLVERIFVSCGPMQKYDCACFVYDYILDLYWQCCIIYPLPILLASLVLMCAKWCANEKIVCFLTKWCSFKVWSFAHWNPHCETIYHSCRTMETIYMYFILIFNSVQTLKSETWKIKIYKIVKAWSHLFLFDLREMYTPSRPPFD